MPVGVVEGRRHLGRDPERLGHWQLAIAFQPSPQRLALDIGHDVKGGPVDLARIEQWQNVRVLEVGGGSDLGQEAGRPDHGGQLPAEDFEGDAPLVAEVVGEVDRRHTPLAELPLDAVAVGQGGAKVVDLDRHRRSASSSDLTRWVGPRTS